MWLKATLTSSLLTFLGLMSSSQSMAPQKEHISSLVRSQIDAKPLGLTSQDALRLSNITT